MRSWLAGLLLAAAGVGPGLLLAEWLLPTQPMAERRIAGLASGAALLIITSYFASALGQPEWALALLGLIALLVVAWRRRSPPGVGTSSAGPREVLPFLLCALAIVGGWLWFALPMLARNLPSGWDPGFHVSIVELIRTNGVLPDTWGQYEPGERFDYPAALHCAMALLARLGGITAVQAYNATFLSLGLLLLLEVWAVGARVGGHPLAGALAVLLLGFTDGWGTLTSQADWGGIANVAGLVLMFGVILATFEPTRRSLGVAALCAFGLALEHHLTFAILMFVVAFLAVLEWLSQRRLSPPVLSAFQATAIAFGTAGLFVLLKPTGRFKLADALRYEGEPVVTLPRLVEYIGLPVLILGGLGLLAALRKERDPVRRLVPGWAIALISFWALFDLVYRIGALWLVHQNWSAFTPTRGLTNAALFLAIAGGAWLWSLVSSRSWRLGAVAVVGVALMALNAPAEAQRLATARASSAQAQELRDVCSAVRSTTPEESILFFGEVFPFRHWLPYLCDREFNYFPDPGYRMSRYRMEKFRIGDPITFAKYARSVVARPVYYLARSTPPAPNSALIWQDAHWRLYEVKP